LIAVESVSHAYLLNKSWLWNDKKSDFVGIKPTPANWVKTKAGVTLGVTRNFLICKMLQSKGFELFS